MRRFEQLFYYIVILLIRSFYSYKMIKLNIYIYMEREYHITDTNY